MISSFHAYYKARELSNYTFGRKKFLAAFASSDIEVYPYQVAAARFALRSPYLKGSILCDEGALGKTYEAMLVIVQMWYEGKNNILIIVPTPLLHQWTDIIEQKFSIPFFSIDNNSVFEDYLKNGIKNPFCQDGIIITTYDFAVKKHTYISQIKWNLSVFDEAHRLRNFYKEHNKESKLLHDLVNDSFKLLLTSTPMQNSILDLYGLINFIDNKVFLNEDTFYKRYFRKPENYGELSLRIKPYCFRTTKAQASTYIKIPERIFITANFTLSEKEKLLYNLINEYIMRNKRAAFPDMDRYDLALMLFHIFSSSTFAFNKTINSIFQRLSGETFKEENIKDEIEQIKKMCLVSKSIKENSKGNELLKALKNGFSKIKKLGGNKKALIFTENLETQKYLYKLLNENGYKNKVLIFNGSNSRNYSIIEKFKTDAEILISTDIASEGFNLEFCSFVVNYDLPYNILTIEQRISRCHRQGQQCDVIVLNFLNKDNFSDVRMLELINKRISQFDGIIGMSDSIAGNFESDISNDLKEILKSAKSKKEIDESFKNTMEKYKSQNKQIIEKSEQILYTSFSKEISDKVSITPQYVEDISQKINNDLWYITKFFFKGNPQFKIDETTRTISYVGVGNPTKVFTGSKMGRSEYSMDKNYMPRSGRHTITGSLARNIINEIFWRGVSDRGSLIVNSNITPCRIAYYTISIRNKNEMWNGITLNTFIGKTLDGEIIENDECKKIMELPVIHCTENGRKYGKKDGLKNQTSPDLLDRLICKDEFIQKALPEINNSANDEINRLKSYIREMKAELGKNIRHLKGNLSLLEKSLNNAESRNEEIILKKQISVAQKELTKYEENLFLEKMKLDNELEDKIAQIIKDSNVEATIKREFSIGVSGIDKQERERGGYG